MALRATTVWEVQTGGNDSNGGGFDSSETSGTDRSLATSPHVTFDGSTVKWTIASAGLTIKIYGHTVATADLGNVLNVTGGTNATVGRYVIDAVTTGAEGTQAWTLIGAGNVSTGEVTDGAGRMGGCLATPAIGAAAATIDGHLVWIKSGTYTLSSATPAAAGGPVLLNSGIRVKVEGYETTRGDRGAKPILDAGTQAGTYALFAIQGSDTQVFVNLKADGGATAGVNASGFNCGSSLGTVVDCEAVDCNQASCYGFSVTASGAERCKASNCTTGFSSSGTGGNAAACEAIDGGVGFSFVRSGTLHNCIAHGNTGDGFVCSSYEVHFINCVADDNGGDGFDLGATCVVCMNCVSTDNGGYGYNTSVHSVLINCAAGVGSAGNDNTSGAVNATPLINDNLKTLTGNPYNGANDYRPDATTNEGALLRAAAAGVPSQTNALDIGAVQHADPAATSGGGVPVFGGNISRRV